MSDSEPAVALTEDGNLEITLPKKSSKFPDKIASRLKASATLIVAITGLIAAIGSWFKPADQTVPKASYETLAGAIIEISKQARDNHDGNLALKEYVDKISGQPIPAPAYSSEIPTPAPIASATPTLRPLSRPRTGGIISRPPSLSAAIASALASHDAPPIASAEPPLMRETKSAPVSQSVLMPDSPAIGPTPPAVTPPSFDAVLKKAGQ